MEMTHGRRRPAAQALTALAVATSLIGPIAAGCGDNTSRAGSNAQAPNYGSVPAPRNAPMNNGNQRQGMSTKQKVAILAGAAALWYLYNKNKNNKGTGENGQYYRSKNGRIYYRDAKGNAVYVTPPANGIQVPADVAERYNRAVEQNNFGLIEGDNFGYSRGNSNDMRGAGEYGGSGYGAPYGSDRVPAGAGAGNGYGAPSSAPPGPRGGGF